MTSLAETLYHAWRRAQHDITAHPAWGNLESEQRLAWEAVAEVARDLCASAVVGYRCTCGIDHMFETREKLAEERAEAIRQRDEAQRAVRDGFPATVAVIRQQRDEAQAEVERLTKERDAARAEERLMVDCVIGAPHNQAVIATTEHAIAKWLEAKPIYETPDSAADIAEEIRSGAWRLS